MFRRIAVQPSYLCASLFFLFVPVALAQTLPPDAMPPGGDFAPATTIMRLPADTILVKGAEPLASDRVTPLPEDGSVVKNVYQNRYLGLAYPLPADFAESYKGPLPSDSGTYVLANILPAASFKGPVKGTVLFSAQDTFFSLTPADSARELIAYKRDHLEPYYDVERPPEEITIAGHTFARFGYTSKVANLHWVVLATQIRCHNVQFVFCSQDVKLLERLVQDMDHMTLPADAGATAGKGGGDWPRCMAGYARPENITNRVEPVLTDHKFNQIPVRLIIDKHGRVKHVHVISAFPNQGRAITEAVLQWTFKPYVVDGEPVEVETGIVFGAAAHTPQPAVVASTPTAKPATD